MTTPLPDIAGTAARQPWAGRRALGVGGALLALGAVLTVSVAGLLERSSDRADVAELESLARDVGLRLDGRLDVVQATLGTLGAQIAVMHGALEGLDEVVAGTGVVEEVPGVLALLFARVGVDQDGSDGVFVETVHPLAPNHAAVGRNLLAEPERRRAVEAARDGATMTATSIVTHVDGDVDAILVMSPVTSVTRTTPPAGANLDTAVERTFLGVVIAVVSPEHLFAAEAARLPVDVVIDDLGPTAGPWAAGDAVEVWTSSSTFDHVGASTTNVAVADRRWRLTVAPGAGFTPPSSAPLVALVAGGFIALLLALLAAVLVGARDRLEEQVRDRTAALRASNERLEAAGQVQSQFITTVSHELRTPLTSVLGYVQTLRRLGPAGWDEAEDYLERAERNGVTLQRMIEDLLDFGRLERGEVLLRRARLELTQEVAQIVDDLAPSFGASTVVATGEPDAWADVDPASLTRIVANLTSNAVRYAAGTGPIDITVRTFGSTVQIICRDRGPGFVEADLPHLHERFVRGAGVMGEGTGIGLAVVTELAHAHGGSVTLGNHPEGGAVVTVRLPAGRRGDVAAAERRGGVVAG